MQIERLTTLPAIATDKQAAQQAAAQAVARAPREPSPPIRPTIQDKIDFTRTLLQLKKY